MYLIKGAHIVALFVLAVIYIAVFYYSKKVRSLTNAVEIAEEPKGQMIKHFAVFTALCVVLGMLFYDDLLTE